jgi:hypothetical protein
MMASSQEVNYVWRDRKHPRLGTQRTSLRVALRTQRNIGNEHA